MKNKTIKVLTSLGIVVFMLLLVGWWNFEYKESIKQLIRQIEHKLAPPPGQSKLYVAYLSFQNPEIQSAMHRSVTAELINKLIVQGLEELEKEIPTLAVNAPGHTIKHNDQNINKLMNITFDPYLTKSEKTNKIINELMIPKNVDIIVTGQYIDNAQNSLISIRPLVIVRADQKIVTRNLQFSKEEFLCEDPVNKKITLCTGAYDQLIQGFLELIEQL